MPQEPVKSPRRAQQVNIKIRCRDNDGSGQCILTGSVRSHLTLGGGKKSHVTLHISGGDEWPHMTPEQAWRLSKWLVQAVDEANARGHDDD